MLRLSKKADYALMAMKHLATRPDAASASAREIADSYGLPFEITAKTLQRLKDTGLIQSAHGAKGGYTLQRSLSDVSLAEFLELMEGPQSVVDSFNLRRAAQAFVALDFRLPRGEVAAGRGRPGMRLRRWRMMWRIKYRI